MPKKKSNKDTGEWSVTSYGDKPLTPEMKKLSNSVGWVKAAHKTERSSNNSSPVSSRSSTPHSHKHGTIKKVQTPQSKKKSRGRPPKPNSQNKFKMVLEKDEDYYIDYESPDEYDYPSTEQESEKEEIESVKISDDNASIYSDDMDFQPMDIQMYDDVSEDEDIPTLDLPHSSLDLLIPLDTVIDALSVYEVLRHFRSTIRMSPVLFEDFCAALADKENNVLVNEVHMSLLKCILKEEEATNVIYGPPDQRDAFNAMFHFIDQMTWPEVLRSFFESSPEFNDVLAIVSRMDYPNVPVKDKLKVLQSLTDTFLSSNRVRDELMTDGTIRYDDHCRVCHKLGDLLCCETCPAVYHLACCNPPLRSVPEEEWQCEVCVAHKLTGVYDCETDMDGPYLRHDPVGFDRHGRKYWFIARRIVVEGDDRTWYYSTMEQLEYLKSKLDSTKYEMALTEALRDVFEQFPRQANITDELTLDANPNEQLTYLTALKRRIQNTIKMEVQKKREEEAKLRKEQEEKKKKQLEENNKENKEHDDKKIEETNLIEEIKKGQIKEEKNEKMEVDKNETDEKKIIKIEENSNKTEEILKKTNETKTEDKKETQESAIVDDKKTDNKVDKPSLKDVKCEEQGVQGEAPNSQRKPPNTQENSQISHGKPESENETNGANDIKKENTKKPQNASTVLKSPVVVKIPISGDSQNKLTTISSPVKVTTGSAQTKVPVVATAPGQPANPSNLQSLQVLRLGAGIQIRNAGSQSGGPVLKTLYVLNKDGTKTQLTLGTPAGKVAPQTAKQLTNQRPLVVLNSSQILQPKNASKTGSIVRKIGHVQTAQRIVPTPAISAKVKPAQQVEEPKKAEIQTPPKPLTHEEEANTYFKLGEDKAYKQYQNQYVENNLALNKYQHKEERDRDRYVGYKFSVTGPGEFKWIGDIVGNKETQMQTIRSTLLHFEHQIPQCFLHSRWEKYRNAWGKIVLKCDNPQSFSAAIGILEMATRNNIKKSVWQDQLGQTRFVKILSSEKEDHERRRKLKSKQDEDEAQKNAVWCKYPIPVRSMMVWKMKGEEYRATGYGGWMWMSSTYKARQKPSVSKPFTMHKKAVDEDASTAGFENTKKKATAKDESVTSKKDNATENTSADIDTAKSENDIPVKSSTTEEDSTATNESTTTTSTTESTQSAADSTEKMEVDDAENTGDKKPNTPENHAKEVESKLNAKNSKLQSNDNKVESMKEPEEKETLKDNNNEEEEKMETDAAHKEKKTDEKESLTDHAPVKITVEIINVSENLLRRDSGVYPKKWSASKVDILLGWRLIQNKTEKIAESAKRELLNNVPPVVKTEIIKPGITCKPPPLKPITNAAKTNELKNNEEGTKLLQNGFIDDENSEVDVMNDDDISPIKNNVNKLKNINQQSKLNHVSETNKLKDDKPIFTEKQNVEKSKKHDNENLQINVKENSGEIDAKNSGKGVVEIAKRQETAKMECDSPKENQINISSENKKVAKNVTEKVGESTEIKKENIDCTETVTTATSSSGEVLTTVTKVVTKSTTIVSTTIVTETIPTSMVQETTVTEPTHTSTTQKRVGLTRMSKIRRDIHRNTTTGSISTVVTGTQKVWKLKRCKKANEKKDTGPAMQLPLPWQFVSKHRKKKSLFRLPTEHVRKLALKGGLTPTAIGFNYTAKNISTLDFYWPYPCPRPTFAMVWRYRLQNMKNISSVAHLLRVLWHCIKWDEITTKPATDDSIDTVTTDEHIITTELLKRKEIGTSGLRMNYFIRRITVSHEDDDEELQFIRGGGGEEYTPSRSGLRSRTRPMNLRERNPKQQRGPHVEHLWVSEDEISLWQIRQFDGMLKLQQRKAVFNSGNNIPSRNATFTAKIDPVLQRTALSAANKELPQFTTKVGSQQQQVYTTVDSKTFNIITSNLGKGQSAKILIQPQNAKVSQAQGSLIRTQGGTTSYIFQNGKFVKPVIMKQGMAFSPDAKQPAANTNTPARTPDQATRKTYPQTQIKLSQAQLTHLLKAGVGTPVKVNVNLSEGKQGMGEIQLIPTGMQVNPTAGQQLMQAKVGGEIRKFLFTHAEANAIEVPVNRVRGEMALQSTASLQQRLSQIQQMQNSGNTTISSTKRLLTDKDPLWGGRHGTTEAQSGNQQHAGYIPTSKLQMRRRLTNRAEREDFHRKNTVANVMKSILDRIERNEEIENRKRKREEIIMKQKAKKEKNENAKVRHKQTHMLQRYKDNLKQDILKRRAIVERFLTISAKNDLHNDIRKKRKSDSVIGLPTISKKQRKSQSGGIVTAAASALLETTNVPAKKKSPAKHKVNHMQSVAAQKKRKSNSNEKLYCICKTPYEPTKFYIGCDLCMNWFHGTCVGILESRAKRMEEWVCPDCRRVQSDPHQELYCVCRTPYDDTKFYIGCDVCQDWYHGACVGVTEAESSMIESYTCPRCQEQQSKDEGQLSTDDYIMLGNILRALKAHKMGWPFLKPVDAKDFPTYYQIVKAPMDLGTVSRRLERKEYKHLSKLVGDVSLIFDNCRQFNGSDSAIAKCAEIVESLFVGKIREYRVKKSKIKKR